jgi:hypothetical protein
VSTPGQDEASARQALPQLAALEAVLADPVRLVRLLQEADDRADAVRILGPAFGLTPEQASVVLDNRFGLLVRGRREALAEAIRILRAPWGPPLELSLRARDRGSAVLELDGVEHTFGALSRHDQLDRVSAFLLEQVAVPRLRPVVLSTDLAGGPTALRIWPSRTTDFEYADDPPVVRRGPG